MTAAAHDDLRTLLRIGLPVIGVNVTQTAMQLIDAAMVGVLGADSLAALTPPGLLLFVLHSAAYGLLTIVTALVAQAAGAGRGSECGRYGWQGMYVAVLASAAVMIVWPLAPGLLAVFPEHGPTGLALEVGYLRIGLLGLLPAMVAMALASFFLGVQRTGVVMVASAVALVVNTATNYVLIYGYAPFPALGLVGAAWGTVLGSFAQATILFGIFVSPKLARRYGTRRWAPRWRIQRTMYAVGGWASAQTAIEVAAWGLIMTWLIAYFGTAHLAAATVLVRCMQLTFLPAEGIALAAQTMVAGAVGAGQPGRARDYARRAFWIVAPYMTSLGLAMYVVRASVMRLFTTDPQVIAIGMSAMGFVAGLQIFDAMAVIYVHALQGVGDNRWPLQATLALTGTVLMTGGLAVIFYFPEAGSIGIWAVGFVYMALVGLALFHRWQTGAWVDIRLLPESPEPVVAGALVRSS